MVALAGGDAAAAHRQPEGRDAAALEPGRPLSRLPLRPRRQEDPGLAARPRGGEAVSSPTSRPTSRTSPGRRTASGSRWSCPTSTRDDPDARRTAEGRTRRRTSDEDAEAASSSAACSSSATARATCSDLRTHIHVFDVARKTSVQVTAGPYDDGEPAWSPDGRWLAFTSNRTAGSRRQPEHRRLRGGGRGRADAARRSPLAGGRRLARLQPGRQVARLCRTAATRRTCGTRTNHVAVGAARRAAPPRPLTRVARPQRRPRRASRPTAASLLLPARGRRQPHLARVPGGRRAPWSAWSPGERDVQALRPRAEGRDRGAGEPAAPARRGLGGRRRGRCGALTRVNDAFLKGIRLGAGRALQGEERGRHADRRLPDPAAGRRGRRELPTILRIHGGPVVAVLDRVRAGVAAARRPRLRGDRAPTRAAPPATAATSAARSGPTGATRTSRT